MPGSNPRDSDLIVLGCGLLCSDQHHFVTSLVGEKDFLSLGTYSVKTRQSLETRIVDHLTLSPAPLKIINASQVGNPINREA